MAESDSDEVGDGDDATVVAYWEALHDFADELNAFHISCGAPSYRDIAKASHEPKLSQAGITEFLKGRRLPQLKALMEFIRVLSLEPHATTGEAASPDAVRQEWRERWTHVRGLQRQAQAPLSHLKTTVKATLEQAEKEAEALRTAARAEASRIRADAEAGADRLTAEAREQADELLERARERAEGLRADDETAEPDKAAPTRLLRLRRLLSRPAPVAAAAVLAVSGSVLGVVLFYGQAPPPCTSSSNAAPSSAAATYLGLQPMGAVAKEQAGAKRLPDSWITNWHLPSGTPAGQSTPTSAPAPTAPSATASATASATPRHPAGRPSASSTSSAKGCR